MKLLFWMNEFWLLRLSSIFNCEFYTFYVFSSCAFSLLPSFDVTVFLKWYTFFVLEDAFIDLIEVIKNYKGKIIKVKRNNNNEFK